MEECLNGKVCSNVILTLRALQFYRWMDVWIVLKVDGREMDTSISG